MKKFLRRTIPLLIPILLLALFSRVPLAQPEQTVPEEARLVGYYLLPDELVPPQLGICRKRLGGIQFPHNVMILSLLSGLTVAKRKGIGNQISLPFCQPKLTSPVFLTNCLLTPWSYGRRRT